MDANLRQALNHLDEVQSEVKRQADETYSRQPRFQPDNPEDVFFNILRWKLRADMEEPEYNVDSRARDQWLAEFWRKEPHLAGVINSVVAIDKNRAWAITGGRNQVNRYVGILRESEGGEGWRSYISKQAQSYYYSDLGALTEIGRDGDGGPLRALYHLDSTKCYLTGNYEKPLHYDGTKDPWSPEDFFRVASLPSPQEDLRGLGYCAVSRVLELVKIMIAVYEHDMEKLGAQSPRGLLLLKNISQEKWAQAMRARKAQLTDREMEWFGAVAVLANEGVDDVDAKLFALSQLPDNFDIEVTTKLLMYAYALGFGYDPIEFWPVEAGALGRGRETEIQHEKATGKGGADFMLSYQDRLQMVMPETLIFEFEQRDSQGMILEANVIKAWADVANALFQGGAGVLNKEQAASLLVQNGIIPPEWTSIEEEDVATDTERTLRRLREAALEEGSVRRAAALYPNEPIVRYSWPSGREIVLWDRGRQALSRRIWRVTKPEPRALLTNDHVQRQDEGESEILFEGEDFTISQADVDGAIADARSRVGDELADVLTARILTDEEIDALNENMDG